MNKILLSLLLFINFLAQSQTYTPTEAESTVTFKIRNLGITVEGTFTGLAGVIQFDPNQLASSRFEVTVNASSLDTGIGLRNKHLKKEEYFDVNTYPHIKFISTKIESASTGRFTVSGKLTIKKTTREIKFDFAASKISNGYKFDGEFTLNRLDYEVGGSSFSMADELNVLLDVSCVQN